MQIRALQKIESVYNMGLSPDDIQKVACNVFAEWDQFHPPHDFRSTRMSRALCCHTAIKRATRDLAFPDGISVWTLFQVLHPEDELPPCRRVGQKYIGRSSAAYEADNRFPQELKSILESRRLRLAGIHGERKRYLAKHTFLEDRDKDSLILARFDEGVIKDLYECSMDRSLLAVTIPVHDRFRGGIGINYFSLYFEHADHERQSALERRAPTPSDNYNTVGLRSDLVDLNSGHMQITTRIRPYKDTFRIGMC